MKHPWLTAMFVFIFIIVFGGAFLVYYEILDGTVMNPPLTFRYGVDPLSLQTDKQYYKPGETVSVYTSFCKKRDAKTTTQWALSDTVLTISRRRQRRISRQDAIPRREPPPSLR
jgi:hypothetical protein